MARQATMQIRNGPNSDPVNGRIEVNGRIAGTDEGYLDFHVKNETLTIRFRGMITAFEFDGQGSIDIDGEAFRARNVVGYDSRTGTTRQGPAAGGGGSGGSASGGGSSGSSGGGVRPPDPTDPPDMDKYQPVELGDVGRDEAIGGGTWIEVDNPDPRNGIVSRYASTNGDETLTIDENDSGGWQALFNRLPKEFNHRIEVRPSAGEHGGNGSSVRTHPMTFGSAGDLVIDGGDRRQCRVEQGINSVSSGKLLNYQLKNISFGALSQFAGIVDVRGCHFEGFDRAGVNSTGTAAISGKNAHLHGKRNSIGGPNDDYGIWMTCSELYALADCTVRGNVAAINMNFGSELREWGNDYSNAPRKFA